MHSKDELIAAHRRVVETFRSNRPTNAAGVAAWDVGLRDDELTAYVLDESAHHVKQCHVVGDGSSDDVLLGWLVDQPQDELVFQIALELGEEALTSAAEAAERVGEMWQAACCWSVDSRVVKLFTGKVASVPFLSRAADALSQVPHGPQTSRLSVRQKDQLEMAVISQLAITDMALLPQLLPRLERLLTTDAAKSLPDVCVTLLMTGRVIPSMAAGDGKALASAMRSTVLFLCTGCEGAPDPAMQEFCCVVLSSTMSIMSECGIAPDITGAWRAFGEDGEPLRAGCEGYSYDKHHQRIISTFNQDDMLVTVGISLPLALHYGDLATVNSCFDKIAGESIGRMLAEPNQAPERMARTMQIGRAHV
jgi:hypothetical protein